MGGWSRDDHEPRAENGHSVGIAKLTQLFIVKTSSQRKYSVSEESAIRKEYICEWSFP